jgi:hypothetical protein
MLEYSNIYRNYITIFKLLIYIIVTQIYTMLLTNKQLLTLTCMSEQQFKI